MRARASQRDYLAIVEAAYAFPKSDADWLRGIADAALPICDQGLGVHAWSYDASDPSACRMTGFGQAGGVRPLERGARDFVSVLSPEAAAVLFPPTPPVEFMHRVFARVSPTPAMVEVLLREQTGDAIGIRGHNPDGRGIVLAAMGSNPAAAFPARMRWALTRVAPHLAAAARLRLQRQRQAAAMDEAEAVFTAKGKLEHLAADADNAARVLPQAVDRRIAANAVRAEPQQALELWRALVAGRWSIVDHTDSDGKRFILAKRNDPSVRDPAALTASERLILRYAAWGHSNKLIAYETGFSPSTVSMQLSSALRKLRVRSRSELTRLLDPLVPERRAEKA